MTAMKGPATIWGLFAAGSGHEAGHVIEWLLLALFAGLGGFFLFRAWRGWRTDWVRSWRWRDWIQQERHPARYWLEVIGSAVGGAVLLSVTLVRALILGGLILA